MLAPGCRQFGNKVFEACCSLTQVGATNHTANQLVQRNSTTLPRYSKYYSRSTNEFRSFRKPKFQQQTQFEKRCSKKLLPFLSEGSSVRWAVQANKQTLYTRCLYSCLYISLHFILVSWLEPHTVAFQTLKETQVSSWALSKKA